MRKRKLRKTEDTAVDIDVVDEFMERAQRSPSYVLQFFLTLGINKLEGFYQRRDQPRVFLRDADDFGVALGYRLNPYYNGRISLPKVVLPSPEQMEQVLLSLKKDEGRKKLAVMLAMENLEYIISRAMTPVEAEQLPILLWKEYDADGFPLSYHFNQSVVDSLGGFEAFL